MHAASTHMRTKYAHKFHIPIDLPKCSTNRETSLDLRAGLCDNTLIALKVPQRLSAALSSPTGDSGAEGGPSRTMSHRGETAL